MDPFDLCLRHFPLTDPGYAPIADDPAFDPARHLALEKPAFRLTLGELGYGAEVGATTPSEVAVTDCFRVLSDEGVAAMVHVCRQLEAHTTANPRIARNTRGGVYRSRFLRDFSRSAELTDHLSAILGAELLPQAMAHQLAHLNYQPLTVGENVDKWHYDTLQVDTVMFVTDPNRLAGGEFQFFRGSRDEMAALREAGEAVPAARIVTPRMPGPGYAVLMQGNYVVHRAAALDAAAERITLVNGYSFADSDTPDYTALGQLLHADPAAVVAAEYGRHVGLRCARRLAPLINSPSFDLGPRGTAARLRRARAELDQAIELLESAGSEEMRHFGD